MDKDVYVEAVNMLTKEKRVYKDVYAARMDLAAYADITRKENYRANDLEFWRFNTVEV